jgi:hypothetical protein
MTDCGGGVFVDTGFGSDRGAGVFSTVGFETTVAGTTDLCILSVGVVSGESRWRYTLYRGTGRTYLCESDESSSHRRHAHSPY